jgi:hypothetical protein
MNSPAIKSLLVTIFFSILAFSAHSILAAPTNFLLLVELSPRMTPRKDATTRTALDLIRTGVHERMQEDQKLELWFYDEFIKPDLVSVTWSANHPLQTSLNAFKPIVPPGRRARIAPSPPSARSSRAPRN